MTRKLTLAQKEHHKLYMRGYVLKQKKKEARLAAEARAATPMKYAHLLEDRVCPGKSYKEYAADGRKKIAPLRAERKRAAQLAKKERDQNLDPAIKRERRQRLNFA